MDNIYGNYDGSGNLQGVYRNNGNNAPFQATDTELEDCCCGAQNSCNNCDPPIPDTLYVTMPSGLAGDFSVYAGNTYTLTWSSGCIWNASDIENSGDYLDVHRGNRDNWQVELRAAANNNNNECMIRWDGEEGYDCDPTRTYDYRYCDDASCNDGSSCSNSSGYPTVSET